jgi:hypothetical protein
MIKTIIKTYFAGSRGNDLQFLYHSVNADKLADMFTKTMELTLNDFKIMFGKN